jgi:hypothetical protein
MTHAASAYGTSWQFARGKAYCRDAAMLQWMAVEAADAVRVAPLARVLALVGLSIAGKAVACRVTGVAAQAPVVLVALHAVRAVLVTTAALPTLVRRCVAFIRRALLDGGNCLTSTVPITGARGLKAIRIGIARDGRAD